MDTATLIINKVGGYYLHDMETFDHILQMGVLHMVLKAMIVLPVYLFKWWIITAPLWLPVVTCIKYLQKRQPYERDKSVTSE